jgi:hypothetical protein
MRPARVKKFDCGEQVGMNGNESMLLARADEIIE